VLDALTPLSNAHFPDERMCLTDNDVDAAGIAIALLQAAIAAPKADPIRVDLAEGSYTLDEIVRLMIEDGIAAPEDEPVAEVDIWVELGRDMYELKQFAGFRDLPIGNHELYLHPAPKEPTYKQGYAQGFKAGTRAKP